ncbi:MAG: hypothetical protein ACOYXR_07025 [Nitrospirota bacterium]
MIRHSKSMVLGLAALGLAVLASPASASNLFTINETVGTGAAGSGRLIPVFLTAGQTAGIAGTTTLIHVPYIGTIRPCNALINNAGLSLGAGDCGNWGAASLTAWTTGLYYDPRFGTPFIPPSGDHHRTGYRMLMQPSFSGGQWLSGFAPLAQRFPFFPEVGTAGPGGDVGLALANSSFQGALNGILEMTDAHGEPLTTGKFPRYWPHERAAWVDNLMVKYTAGGGDAVTVPALDASAFNQSIRSSMSFARNHTVIRWRAMSNLDGHFALDQDGSSLTQNNSDGCGGSGWCEFYIIDGGTPNDYEDLHLYVIKGANGNTGGVGSDNAAEDATALEITQVTKLDTIGALNNGGTVLVTKTLTDLEKLPSVIDDRLAQYLGGEAPDEITGAPQTPNTGFEQQIISQFRVYSGPNVHSEEGADPYSWVICGDRGHNYGEDMCGDPAEGGAIDAVVSTTLDANGVTMAMVYNSNNPGGLADSVLKRFGNDLNPARVAGDPYQSAGVYVACTDSATLFGTPVVVSGVTYYWNSCVSDPGADGFYGSADDGTIYYKEAIENGLRGWIRETNGHAFSFLGASENGGATAANFGLNQLVEQRDDDPTNSSYLMSCLNCSPHVAPPSTGVSITFNINWPAFPDFDEVGHPPVNGGLSVTQLP